MATRDVFVLQRSKSISCEAEVVEDRPSVPIICPKFPGHRRARRLQGRIIIDVEKSDSTDCLWTFFSDCLLNDEVLTELSARGCTGFTTGEVEANGNPTGKTYSQFRAAGWGGMAPPVSGIRETERCEFCGHLTYSGIKDPSRLFNSTKWDGSDVFFIWPLPKFICVTSKVASLFSELAVTGVQITPITELQTTMRGFSPGRLSNLIPKDRANEIGRPLGIE